MVRILSKEDKTLKEISEYGKLQRKLRKEQKLSIRSLSELSGVSHSYLSQVENGERPTPSPEIINKIATALKYDYFVLMRAAGYLNSDFAVLSRKGDPLSDFLNAPIEAQERILLSQKVILMGEIKTLSTKELTKKFNEWKSKIVGLGDWIGFYREIEGFTIEELSSKTGISEESLRMIEKEGDIISKDTNNLEYNLNLNQLVELEEVLNINDLHKAFGFDKVFNDSKELVKEYIENMKKEKWIVSFSVPKIKTNEENENTIIKLSEEEAKQRFLYLENLLTMEESIYLNSRVLSKREKEKALQLLKLVFEETENNSEE